MNILLENGNVNPPFIEGTGNILLSHARELAKRGHRVIILTRIKSIITGKKYPKYEEIEGIKFYRWSNYFNLMKIYPKIIDKEKIEIIHIFSKGLRPSSYIWFLKKFIRKPIIFSSIGFPSTEEDPQEKFESSIRTQKRLINFTKNVDLFILTSKYILDKTPAFRSKNCMYLPYGIDMEKFKPRKKYDSNKKKIIYLRSPKKELLDAFRIARANKDSLIFCFNKDYIYKNENLKKFIEEDSRDIELIPRLKDISPVFNDAEIVIDIHNNKKYLECASPPLLILEAMACEKKIISSQMGEIEEFITNGKNGFLVKGNTPKEIYSAIKTALKAKKSVEKNARKTISQKYNIKEVTKDYEKLYQTIINKNRKKGWGMISKLK